jgi:hypothetical protein
MRWLLEIGAPKSALQFTSILQMSLPRLKAMRSRSGSTFVETSQAQLTCMTVFAESSLIGKLRVRIRWIANAKRARIRNITRKFNSMATGWRKQGRMSIKLPLLICPTSGGIDEMHIELYDYDESVALKGLERMDNIQALLAQVDVEANPAMWR